MKIHSLSAFCKRALQGSLLVALFLSAHALRADLDPANNNPMPEALAVDIADLLALKDVATDDAHFGVTVALEVRLCNLLGKDDETHAILYTDKVAPYITCSKDSDGVWHYVAVAGQDAVILGYSKCLDAGKFRDALCKGKDAKKNYTVDAQFDTNNETYVYVKLGSTYTTPKAEGLEEGYAYYQWIDADGDWYWLYSDNYANGSNGFDKDITGEIWVGVKADIPPTNDWTVTGNKKDGLTTLVNGKKVTQ